MRRRKPEAVMKELAISNGRETSFEQALAGHLRAAGTVTPDSAVYIQIVPHLRREGVHIHAFEHAVRHLIVACLQHQRLLHPIELLLQPVVDCPLVLPYHQIETHESDGHDGHTAHGQEDRKSTRLNSSHVAISYAVFC